MPQPDCLASHEIVAERQQGLEHAEPQQPLVHAEPPLMAPSLPQFEQTHPE